MRISSHVRTDRRPEIVEYLFLRMAACAGAAVALVGTAMLTTALPAEAVQNYIATPLGSLGGVNWGVPESRAYAINAFGQVTGNASVPQTVNESRHSHAFIHANGVMIDLGTLGGQSSYASAINNSGQVTGASNTALTDLEGTVTHAFLYSNGKLTDLGSLGGRYSTGAGINTSGQVVGWSLLHDGVTQRAFLYSGGSMTDLGTLGGASSQATGINDSTQVTGGASTRAVISPGDDPLTHAFLYSGGAMMDLGTLGGRSSWANGINNAGQVTGAAYIDDDTASHAFLYSGGRMIDLGTLGGSGSTGTGINNSGYIIGFAKTTDDKEHAFLYADGKMYDLNNLVTNDLGPGVVLRYAQGINDRGQIAAVGCTVFGIESACQAYRLDPIATPSSANYQGLWWNAPAGSESGWGINFAHQGDTIFATWYTYHAVGEAWWLSMTANRTAEGTYTGTLLKTAGPAFNAVPFDPAKVTRTPVGTGTLTFSDADNGRFAYTVEGVQQTKMITRQVFGPLPTCTYATNPDFTSAANYQDLWWVGNGAESGWGINLTHQGDIIFATWFTYDVDGTPLWLSATAPKAGNGIYSGTLYRTSGPPFNAAPFDPAKVNRTVVGAATFTFANGNAGSFAYTVNGVTQTKAITRQLFAPPAGTVCSSPVRVPTAVTVASPTPSPWVGETVQLSATVRDQFGYVLEGTATSWSSSNSNVATISANGTLQGQAKGPVVMKASVGSVSGSASLTVTPMPRISVAVGTTKEVVFRWATDRCTDLDLPDEPARYVRAEDGSLVLIAGNAPRVYLSRGADFNSLKRDCSQPALVSADRTSPESYENYEWLWVVYREGLKWHALIHNEYHDPIASTCKPGDTSPANPCWYNSITYAVSTDGGHSFSKPLAPAHVVAPPHDVWVPPLPGEKPPACCFAEGYRTPSNIVRGGDGYYYALILDFPTKYSDGRGVCVIRSNDLHDPASWRAWNGYGFNLRMTSPYVTGSPATPCTFLDIPGGGADAIVYESYLGRYLLVNQGGWPVCGLYFSLSADLIHWSEPQLLVEANLGWCTANPQSPAVLEPVNVGGSSIIDHADTTINFEVAGRTPYLYYVRFNDGSLDRDLVRVPLTFIRQD